ncbi:IS607 family transposase [Ktedonobacter racemifer]|uniref:Resolvase domain protein n=1 Tax=Ktedonobacter racemifer DSM 44963 TaxID=485913 RepID=D6TWB4_KTERA|nr:IS607 family transposase [Ktedonobacter racemifer]EFH84497.1 Resolvase domain protein [Ktedonobacter racemifer DSM 44963]
MYSVTQFAKQVGVSVKTLQRWDREGRLKAKRTLSGRRYYTEADLATALNLPQRPAARRTIAYCRVSSPAQRPDLQNQRVALSSYAVSKQLVVDEWMMEIGGGLNVERKRFLALVDAIVAGEVERVLIAHQDRLARFGFALIKHLCETHHTELVVMNTETLSPEQELVQDVMSILHCFSSRLDGLRNYRKAVEKALKDENRAQDPDEPHS